MKTLGFALAGTVLGLIGTWSVGVLFFPETNVEIALGIIELGTAIGAAAGLVFGLRRANLRRAKTTRA